MTADFREVVAAHTRCFHLDRGGVVGWLEPDDVSLTYSAAAREVTRHQGGHATVVGDDIFEVLESLQAEGGQWFGYFGYAARPDLPARPSEDLPDAVWMRPSRVHRATGLPQVPIPPTDPGPTPVPPAYAGAFDAVQDELYAGNSYEVNLTYRTVVGDPPEADAHGTPAEIYLRLRGLNPAPYGGFLQHDVPGARAWLLSSSPERYALVTREAQDERWLETRPIKGTTARGATPEEDATQAERLRSDPKFRAENLMIVDLLRNDVGMVSAAGSVSVPSLMEVESYASVHQLVSTVRGRLREEVDTIGALRTLFPAGSMTGAPKLRTMQIIDAVEATPRGAYAGAFGWISTDGRADLGVIIRTLTSADAQTWTLGVGGGITVASTVEDEYAEAELKAARLLAALGGD